MSLAPPPRFRPVAEHGLLVEFGEGVSTVLHDRVLALDAALAVMPPQGLIEVVPGNACLLVRFDVMQTDHSAIITDILHLLTIPARAPVAAATHEVEICYDPPYAPDLSEVAKASGLSAEAVIEAHLSGAYSVYMYGFAPGYAYLTGTPEPIRLPRKQTAIRDVPAGSVLIAASQCIVSTLKMPTGWWIIGRSPGKILTGDPGHPFLFDPGDQVRFRRITRQKLEAGNG